MLVRMGRRDHGCKRGSGLGLAQLTGTTVFSPSHVLKGLASGRGGRKTGPTNTLPVTATCGILWTRGSSRMLRSVSPPPSFDDVPGHGALQQLDQRDRLAAKRAAADPVVAAYKTAGLGGVEREDEQ